ncbi:MAG TPA: glycosyltransferase family 39 protein [Candidatus Limnocylindria bacterium]|nr:glycosyltransferase family 39 protein [Candidatus Limnocylindria bacterium]
MSRRWLIVLALGVAVVGAAVLRFWELANNPGGLYLDEAAEALSAHRLLTEPGYHPIFFADGGGREALYAYLVAGAFRLFGESTLTLRATAATLGVAAIPTIWLLGRRFGEVAGLAAAGWAAGSLWLIAISRDGMRNVLVPVMGALALATILWWHDQPSRGRAVIAGGVTAVAALYTYQPLKLLPVLVLVWLLWLRRVDRPGYLRLRPSLLALGLAFLVVAAPMLGVAALDPADYFGRALGVTVGSSATQSAGGLLDHWLRTLGMFAVTGDPNQRHDVDALPLLGWPVFLVALAGLTRLWRRRRDAAHALLLWSLPLFLVPPLLATEGGTPHFLRSLGLAAPLAAAFGLGVTELLDRLSHRWGPRLRGPVAAAVAVGLLALAAASGTAYLSRPVAARYEAYRYDLVAVAGAARPSDTVILDDYSATVVRFLDADRLPAIRAPGTPLSPPIAGGRVMALSRGDLAAAIGANAAASAQPIAWDPGGAPSAWAWRP